MANDQNLKPFVKGYDPRRNLKGRPVDTFSIKTIVKEILESYEEEIGSKKVNGYEMIAIKLVQKSVSGDLGSIRAIINLLESNPMEPILPSNHELSDEEKKRIDDFIDSIEDHHTLVVD